MNPDDVAIFLRTHPQFFDQHPELLEKIQVPHPYGGRAIPLAERQTLALREKLKLVEGKLVELVRFGEENDAISEKVHRLSVALVGAPDFPALAQSLYLHLREDFAVPHVALRIWGKSVPADFPEAASVDPAQREHAEAMTAPSCGAGEGSPFLPWFGDAAGHVRSLALVPLGALAGNAAGNAAGHAADNAAGHAATVFGALALGSEDPQRFYPDMGVLYLRRIGELCAAGVGARL